MQNMSHDIRTNDKDNFVASARVAGKVTGASRSRIDASRRITEQEKRQSDIFGPIMQQKNEKEDKTLYQTGVSASPNRTGLPDDVKTNMEAGFNTDFSDIRIHTNSPSAPKVKAVAFTRGRDVHFSPGQFNPGTSQGRQIIGHELAHVVQQREGRVQPTGIIAGMPVNDNPGLEREADAIGMKVGSVIREKTPQTTQQKSKKKPNISEPIQRQDLEARGNIIGGVLQRRVLISFDGGDIVTSITITGRPGWLRVAEVRHPAQPGFDRRHIIAWALIRRDIEDNIHGMRLPQIRDYLLNPANFGDPLWATTDVIPRIIPLLERPNISDAIEYYAQARFNDPGNLFMGPSQPNRALGVRIMSAYAQMLDAFEEWNPSIDLDSRLPEPYELEYPFWDERTGEVESAPVPIHTYSDVVNWYANMALDWSRYKDWQTATPWFLRHIANINPELARVMEERAAAKRTL